MFYSVSCLCLRRPGLSSPLSLCLAVVVLDMSPSDESCRLLEYLSLLSHESLPDEDESCLSPLELLWLTLSWSCVLFLECLDFLYSLSASSLWCFLFFFSISPCLLFLCFFSFLDFFSFFSFFLFILSLAWSSSLSLLKTSPVFVLLGVAGSACLSYKHIRNIRKNWQYEKIAS